MSGLAPAALLGEAFDAGRAHGLDAVGATTSEPFDEVRRSLERRRGAGQHGGMSFTFKNPRRSTDPGRLLRDAGTLLVGARAYAEQEPPRPPGAVARVARYAWRDHYADLEAGLGAMADVLREHGHRAVVVADQNALVDRAAAHRGGLGWWGKNSNLLLPGAGSWFVLGSVATDAVLPVDAEPVADGCRTCTRCLDACPTGAIVDDGVIDARRCLAWLVQDHGTFPWRYRVALGDRIYGCDDCQDVCPPGRRTVTDAPDRLGADEPQAWVDVLEMLRLDDAALLERFGRWYIPRREPRYLRRNALIVLGNVGDAADPRHRDAVAAHTTHPDPLLRAHAVWAAARLGLEDLVQARADDDHPLVRAEVAMAPEVPRRGSPEVPVEVRP